MSQTRKPPANAEDIFALIGKSQNIEEAASALQAMAHPIRIKVLCLLSSGEMAVQDINEAIGTTQSNISQHLRVLRASGLIESRKEGTRALYFVSDARILKLVAMTRDVFCTL
ncbi:MAG TPA: metalloregulator ArsR/SmtB family transcription factor [Usitatibacteraceae bacterium]|nr:metalloregulator ArsR/SmtB family transcription factor [Usitatibacteraceae bacterium]